MAWMIKAGGGSGTNALSIESRKQAGPGNWRVVATQRPVSPVHAFLPTVAAEQVWRDVLATLIQ